MFSDFSCLSTREYIQDDNYSNWQNELDKVETKKCAIIEIGAGVAVPS